jgi:hypothetical protein
MLILVAAKTWRKMQVRVAFRQLRKMVVRTVLYHQLH